MHAKGSSWKEFYPAIDKDCTKCDKTGHFAKVCRSEERSSKASKKKPNRNAEVEVTEAEVEANTIKNDCAYLFAFETAEKKYAKKTRQKREGFDRLANIHSRKSMPSMILY